MTPSTRLSASKRPHVPAYREHKPSGQARVIIDGKQVYLGRFGTPESWEKYNQLVAERIAAPTPRNEPGSNGLNLTVVELGDAYREWADGYYVKNGRLTGHIHQVKRAVRSLREKYGRTPARHFGPLKLRAIQQHLIEVDWSRTYINDLCAEIRRVFKWGVSHELVPSSVYEALRTLAALNPSRADCRHEWITVGMTLLRLTATDTVDVDRTSTSTEQFKSSVNVNAVNTLAAILAELSRHGLDLLADATGRVYVAGPPEAVAVLPTELAEAMEANWPALSRLATPEPPGSEEVEPARLLPQVWLAGSLVAHRRQREVHQLRSADSWTTAAGEGRTIAETTTQAQPRGESVSTTSTSNRPMPHRVAQVCTCRGRLARGDQRTSSPPQPVARRAHLRACGGTAPRQRVLPGRGPPGTAVGTVASLSTVCFACPNF
jgi:hypothetical protein